MKLFLTLLISVIFLAQCIPNTEAVKTGIKTGIKTEKPDFAKIVDIKAKKKAFFNFLRPLVVLENDRILKKRTELQNILTQTTAVSKKQVQFIEKLSAEYKFKLKPEIAIRLAARGLLRRVDKVPASIALAQAANESSWGTSRFARTGNNYFGIWCYTKGCGIVPNHRSTGANHEVRSFKSVDESVRYYIKLLNTGAAFASIRKVRQEMRKNNLPLSGKVLAKGLQHYSSRKNAYVKEISQMISQNKLDRTVW